MICQDIIVASDLVFSQDHFIRVAYVFESELRVQKIDLGTSSFIDYVLKNDNNPSKGFDAS